MKIWWLNHHARPPVVPGITRHYNLARSLGKLGYQVTVIASSFDHLGTMLPEGPDFGARLGKPLLRDYDGVDFLSIPTPGYEGNSSLGRLWNMYSFYSGALKALKSEEHGRPDMVIGSVVHTWGAFAGYRLAKHFGVPFVYELRDLWPLTPIEIGSYSKWHPFLLHLGFLDRKMAREADLIITAAPLMKEYYIERFGIPEGKFLWITNGTDLDLFRPSNQEKEKNSNKFDLYYTGALGMANGLDAVFDRLGETGDRFPGFRLVVIGDGPLKDHLRKRAKEEQLPVEIMDAVAKKDLPSVLKQADACLVYLLPSRLYRFGISLNKLADYMAAGKPVLFIGDCAENPVPRSRSGIVAKDIKGFSEALEGMIGLGHEERVGMGNRGRAFAEENYDWDKLARKVASAMEEIIRSRQEYGKA